MCSGEDSNSEQYIVEQVVGKDFFKGELHYLIKWKGYSDEENTWEPLRNCTGALQLILEFEEKEKNNRSRSDGAARVGRKFKSSDNNREAASRRKTDINGTSESSDKLSKALNDCKSGGKRLKKITTSVRKNVCKSTAMAIPSLHDLDSDHENLQELNTRRKNSSNDLDTTLIGRINAGNVVKNDKMLCTVTTAWNSKDASSLRKCSASEIEIVGAEPTNEGVIIGVKAKNADEVIRFDSREVTDLWPELYVSFLERHIVFEEK